MIKERQRDATAPRFPHREVEQVLNRGCDANRRRLVGDGPVLGNRLVAHVADERPVAHGFSMSSE